MVIINGSSILSFPESFDPSHVLLFVIALASKTSRFIELKFIYMNSA